MNDRHLYLFKEESLEQTLSDDNSLFIWWVGGGGWGAGAAECPQKQANLRTKDLIYRQKRVLTDNLA